MSVSDEEHIRYLWKNVNSCKVVILMAKVCGCDSNGSQHTSLLCPPGNLKECIDWILCVCGKDGLNGGDGSTDLGKEVAKLLQKAESYLTEEINKHNGANGAAKTKLEKDKEVLETVKQQLNQSNGTNLIKTLADKLKAFIGYNNGNLNGSGIGNKGNGNGTKYTSSYKDDANWNATCNKNDQQQCASIFLGTIPVIFSGLTYLYWQCDKGNAKNWTTGNIHETNPLGIYFVCSGYDSNQLNQNKKANAVQELLGQQFTEFTNGAKVNGDYSKYINEVLTKTKSGNANVHPLSSLYIASQYHFQSTFRNGDPNRVPCSIREMLYWLMALPYSGCFQLAPDVIKSAITKVTENSGTKGSIEFVSGPTLTTNDPHSCYISTTCHYAAVVLCTMQGTICDNTTPKSPKGFHDIYSNTAFNFEYPTTANALFPVLWDIVYFLLTQLYFLKRQCKFDLGNACGWYYCKYGTAINTNGTAVLTPLKSWICQQADSKDHTQKCGSTNPSPLQAFLTDCLTGFQCANDNTKLPYTDHISHRQFHLYCPVPMGFNKDCLSQSPRAGYCIYWILYYSTQDKNDRNSVSLDNIIICLMCCSLRTPRTVGDLFSFFLHAGFFLKNGGVDTKIPWNCKDASSITDALKTVAGKKHNGTNHSSDADLYTLYNSECNKDKTCGNYLQSLSYSIYCNISEIFAMSYLSRIVYLTDVLKSGLKVLLTEFNNLKCEHCTHCKHQHNAGEHGNQCKCPTIVQCGDVLPLFFKYGFTYYYAAALNGYDSSTGKTKPDWLRICHQFSTQLTKVINNAFKQLLDAINQFLTCIRQPFLLYLLTFWLVAILYFSYSLTISLDVLHLRSHLHTAVLTPLVLLTNYTQPHDITYFTP
ncbi:uncharacterized protein BXIN_1819 [Babesia sp. Xinjiang]|uniref:uncharacterized protein n=1 Tax=Babesia sp. Xinjiang TaxID=462227 RepID=UPI000A25ECBF|nr:uncharacterized protein BXIN_1819 [Babesia sp. Xinjiang]ORM40634.1 hypothetical protein BXIN_1819 [Babesia sp. Xinjiang]